MEQQAPDPFRYRIALDGLPLAGSELYAALAVVWGALLTLPLVVYYAWPELDPEHRPISDLDIDDITASGVRAAPPSMFEDMTEGDALTHAQRAMEDDNPEKGQAILDRWDELTDDEDDEDQPDDMAEDVGDDPQSAGDFAQERTAGVVNAFTEEETTEDDIGGYYHDIAFIVDSLTSKAFRIIAIFMLSMAATFLALYQGGIGVIKEDFLSRIPPEVLPEEGLDAVNIVALHPVEPIIFEVKMSVIAGVVATLPFLLFYAWPAIEERLYGVTREFETDPPLAEIQSRWNQVGGAAVVGGGAAYYALANGLVTLPEIGTLFGVALTETQVGYAAVAAAGFLPGAVVGTYHAGASIRERIDRGGKQNVFLLWVFVLAGGLVGGSLIGYFFIAPGLISYLVYDALNAGVEIKYRINNFFWLIFATTIGIGLLADVPMTMWLFHRGGIVSFATMRARWREVVIAIVGVSAFFTPSSLLSMFLMAIPVSAAYLLGLAGLWVVTLPWRARDRVGAMLSG